MTTKHFDDGDDDQNDDTPDPVIDANNLGEDGTRIGEGHDPIEDTML